MRGQIGAFILIIVLLVAAVIGISYFAGVQSGGINIRLFNILGGVHFEDQQWVALVDNQSFETKSIFACAPNFKIEPVSNQAKRLDVIRTAYGQATVDSINSGASNGDGWFVAKYTAPNGVVTYRATGYTGSTANPGDAVLTNNHWITGQGDLVFVNADQLVQDQFAVQTALAQPINSGDYLFVSNVGTRAGSNSFGTTASRNPYNIMFAYGKHYDCTASLSGTTPTPTSAPITAPASISPTPTPSNLPQQQIFTQNSIDLSQYAPYIIFAIALAGGYAYWRKKK